jgi:hypothetical protein
MRNGKKYLFAAIGGLALIGVGILLSPRRIEAQYSSPVRVLNTSAAPALTSKIDDPGRIPFLTLFSNGCSGTLCSYNFPAVPAGHRLVIQHISGALIFNTAPTQLFGFVKSSGNSNQIQFSVIPPSGTVTVFDQPVLYYVDGGQGAVIQFTSGATNFNSAAGQNLTLVGYELDCNAAPCAAIATQ